MAAFVPYLLAVQFLLLMLVGYYRLFLARQRRFGWNRAFLLGGMVAALVLPALRLDFLALPSPISPANLPLALPAIAPAPITAAPVVALAPAPAPEIPTVVLPMATAPAATSTTCSAVELAVAVYALGVGLALAMFLLRNLRILRLIRRSPRERQAGYTLVISPPSIGPASYFHYIFWPQGLDPESTAVALAHERCHSRQLHTLDLMAVELLKALCWINPAVYLLRQDLRRIHEYLADAAAIQVAGPQGLQRLLLLRQLGPRHLQLATYFNSHIKARLTMLSTSTPRKSILAYLCILPLAGLMAACTSFASAPATAVLDGGKDSTQSAAAADSAFVGSAVPNGAPAPANTLFDLDDVFVRAQMASGVLLPTDKGLVCLGEEPPIFRMDTVYNNQDLAWFEGRPRALNLNKVAKLIGYPEAAKAQKLTATVLVKVLVDEAGHTIRHIFLKEADPLFHDAVNAHVRDLVWTPGSVKGQPAKWWVVVPFYMGEGC
jgi:beta-lactamase regulating signal transducer with metallopeptidase domain